MIAFQVEHGDFWRSFSFLFVTLTVISVASKSSVLLVYPLNLVRLCVFSPEGLWPRWCDTIAKDKLQCRSHRTVRWISEMLQILLARLRLSHSWSGTMTNRMSKKRHYDTRVTASLLIASAQQKTLASLTLAVKLTIEKVASSPQKGTDHTVRGSQAIWESICTSF